jgi:transcriptional regulator GlxA family with amidase domain/YHS domain-containing protein
MKRRDLLQGAAAFGMIAAAPFAAIGKLFAATAAPGALPGEAKPNPLKAPSKGSIPVAFLISDGAVVIDFCGPWEVFQDAYLPGHEDSPFALYTVSESRQPVKASGGMTIVPDQTFATAPQPKIIVIPAQSKPSPATLAWVREASRATDVTMSVCTGAFLLAKTGLLNGRSATTHHSYYRQFAMDFPEIRLHRGARFVEDGNLASAGGLSSGIDLALRVVDRYFGREVATATAYQMEYQGHGWLDPTSNAVYAAAWRSTDQHPLCAVCGMDVDKKSSPSSVYKAKSYYFCTLEHKQLFDADPARYLAPEVAH